MAVELVVVGAVPSNVDLTATHNVVGALNAEVAGLPDGVINASLVDRTESQRMNKSYSGNDYATDVLSFSYIEDGEPIDGVVGEIAICTPIAEEQAKEAGTNLNDEVALLMLHGILHISGRDHQNESEQRELQALQAKLMTAAGNNYREFEWTK